MADSKLDLLQGTSLTRGVGSRGRDSARRTGIVKSLTVGTREQLQEAITELESEAGSSHPDDSTLPLQTISVRHIQASDKVMASLSYRRPTSRVDLSRAANEQTNRHAGTMGIEWWRDSLFFDSFGMPDGDIVLSPFNLEDERVEWRPRSYSYTVGVVQVELPTILNSEPAIQHVNKVGRVNSNNDTQFLQTGGFPPGSLLFNGWSQTYMGSGQWLVIYSATYMQERWPYMHPPWYDPEQEQWVTSVISAHPSENLAGLPVHNPIS